MKSEIISMSMKELDQITIIKNVIDKKLTQKKACELLNYSLRHIKRKVKLFKKYGPTSLKHKNRGKPSNNKISFELKEKILAILRTKLQGFGPTLAQEKLEEIWQIKISIESLRVLMMRHELWTAKTRKNKLHIWRERKHCKGELVQLDGSEHIWLNNQYHTMLVFIDDATSELLHLKLVPSESTESIAIATKEYLEKHGRPLAFYTDRGKVFKVNNSKNKERMTQFNRMLEELNIKIIYAFSPEAKGRVERANRTLQDRIVKEIKLYQLKTLEEVNKYLIEYMIKHNKKFAVQAKSGINLHRSIDGINLDRIFCIKKYRILKDDNTIVFNNRWLLLDKKQIIKLRPKAKIEINIAFDNTISLAFNGQKLNFKEIQKRPKKEKEKKYNNNPRLFKPSPLPKWLFLKKGDISTWRKR